MAYLGALRPPWLVDVLACPRDRLALDLDRETLICPSGHRYPVVSGVPVLLIEEVAPTHHAFDETLAEVAKAQAGMPSPPATGGHGIDPFVEEHIVDTCGQMYRHVRRPLPRYPIPHFPLNATGGELLLDVGCNWGRWTIAASVKGYRAVGIDPSLKACLTGRRVCRELGHDVGYVAGDARYLPFRDDAFDVVFSYSVLQHFDKRDARLAVREMARVSREGGVVLAQMANAYGIRSVMNRLRQAATGDQNPFRVRYWAPSELIRCFSELVGDSRLAIDGFFTLNARPEDLDLLPIRFKIVVLISECLRRTSSLSPFRWLVCMADSLWVQARKCI